MLQLDVWLRVKGTKIEENLWRIPKYRRALKLAEFAGVGWYEDHANIILDYEFSGHLTGSWALILAEVARIKEVLFTETIIIKNPSDIEIESILIHCDNFQVIDNNYFI